MTEQQPFELARRYDGFDLRRYPPHVVAEVTVSEPFEQAGNSAFKYLFGYISGQNRSQTSVLMTAPVIQTAESEQDEKAQGEKAQGKESQKVAMTAPVLQRSTEKGTYVVSFVLPASMTAATAPEPTDSHVLIRTVESSLVAAAKYSGRWTQDSYENHSRSLLEAVAQEGLKAIGNPRFARFDPPFKPWFLRHNEVLVDVQTLGV